MNDAVRLMLKQCAFAIVLLSVCPSVRASTVTGQVVMSDAGPMSGVTVSLVGNGGTVTTTTAPNGSFRFEGVEAGRYTIKWQQHGIGSRSRAVEIRRDRIVQLRLTLDVRVEEAITVLGEMPMTGASSSFPAVLFTRRDLRSTLERDPWAVLQTAPGVLTDRLANGGEQTSEQVTAVSKGATGDQNSYAIDGVTITDMTQAGASPMFFDFESFDSIKVTTAGSDPEIGTPGARVELTTMHGTEDLTGSVRWFFTRDGMQASVSTPDEAQGYSLRSTRIEQADEYGIEAGGPMIHDRVWFFASASQHTLNLVPAGQTPYGSAFGGSDISNLYARITARTGATHTFDLLFIRSDLSEEGRGVSSVRPEETGLSRSAPSMLIKADGVHFFSPTSYVELAAAIGQFGYTLTPAGGMDVNMFVSGDQIPHRSYPDYDTDRPQRSVRLAYSHLLSFGSVSHAMRAAIEERAVRSTESRTFPGTGTVGQYEGGFVGTAALTRPANARYSAEYYDAHIVDNVVAGRNAITAALRLDVQRGRNESSSTAANGLFPELLPAASFNGDSRDLEWRSLSPRLGLSRQLDAANRVRVRASLNRYVDQLGARVIGSGNPFFEPQQITYSWRDDNQDQTVQRGEAFIEDGPVDWNRVDPNNPLDAASTRRIDYSMKAPRTDEVSAGFDIEPRPAMLLSIDYVHRNRNDFVSVRAEKTQGAGDYYTRDDYVLAGTVSGATPDGQEYAVPYYRLAPGVPAPRWFVVTNRPDYSQSWNGFDIVLQDRRSRRWMYRVAGAWGEWIQHAGEGAAADPTPILDKDGCSTCDGAAALWSPATEEEIERNIFINSRWSLNATAVVFLPWKTTVTMNTFARQGYPVPYYRRIFTSDQTGAKNVLVGGTDTTRLPSVRQLDARVAKDLRVRGRLGVTLSLDVFNFLNRHEVLERNNLLSNIVSYPDPANNHIVEIQSPRVLRAGVRVTF